MDIVDHWLLLSISRTMSARLLSRLAATLLLLQTRVLLMHPSIVASLCKGSLGSLLVKPKSMLDAVYLSSPVRLSLQCFSSMPWLARLVSERLVAPGEAPNLLMHPSIVSSLYQGSLGSLLVVKQ